MGASGGSMLRVSTSQDAETITSHLEGEVDLASSALLCDALEGAIAATPRRVVVDAAGLTYLDSCGINCLLQCGAAADVVGTKLVVRNVSIMVRRVLSITGVESVLLEDAARDAPGACA